MAKGKASVPPGVPVNKAPKKPKEPKSTAGSSSRKLGDPDVSKTGKFFHNRLQSEHAARVEKVKNTGIHNLFRTPEGRSLHEDAVRSKSK